ncbi:hypothetical protein EBI_26741 [Enterocytozoon bieneusi H348]|nr:hypothetical protein EBI_26741 [Enterocytozoon bieneusi H348]|eukprot:XP_002650804.1 hypothetical protein EBI_26741 [Enterocytozoon bieneusi H348]
MMENLNSPEHVQYLVDGTVVEIGEAKTEMDAEKAVSHMKGYISALRYSNVIDHALFKPSDDKLDRALVDWHRKNDALPSEREDTDV